MSLIDIIRISALQSKAGIKVETTNTDTEILENLVNVDLYTCQKEYIYKKHNLKLIDLFQDCKDSFCESEWNNLLKREIDFSIYDQCDFKYASHYAFYFSNPEEGLRLSKLSRAASINLIGVYKNLDDSDTIWDFSPVELHKAAELEKIRIDNLSSFVKLNKIPYMWELMQFISRYWISLNVSYFESITDDPKQILNRLIRCNIKYKPKKEEMQEFIFGLKRLNCNLDLLNKILKANPKKLPSGVTEIINVAFNERYHLLLESADSRGIEFICHVLLSEKKYKFLDKLQQSKFVQVGHLQSRVMEDKNKMKIFNLNEFTVEDINQIGYSDVNIEIADTKDTKVSPKEFITLNNSKCSQAFRIYDKLEGTIDAKILNFRQLMNAGVTRMQNDVFFERVNKRPFQSWKKDFCFGIQNQTLIKRLSLEPKFDSLVGECRNESELLFVCRNYEMLDADKFLTENMNNFMENDTSCIRLMKILNLPDEFIREHMETIKKFCITGDADIAVTYYDNANDFQKNALLKIVKAELAEEMERFKFYNIEREIEIDNDPKLIEAWKKNIHMTQGKYFGFESYNFHDTMMIGVLPTRTCMNYRDGIYNNCLLANFDSNKKVIYVKRNEEIVGRAIIRLTKYLNKDEANNDKVAFLDISKEQEMMDSSEKCTVYIEKVYTSGVNTEEETIICNLIADMVKAKMQNVNCMVMGCSDYRTAFNSKGTKRVFISHTKNREQYMDSFGGENNASNEARYVNCTAYYDEES